MTDIHSHILPNIDDGAKSIEVSVEMAEIAASEGISNIICTPHALKDYLSVIQLANEKREYLQYELDARGIPLNLFEGYEVHINEHFLDFEYPERLSLNSTNYILIETNFESVPQCMEEALYLIKISKLIPVLAHPERYVYLHKNLALCQKWRKEGMLFQVNTGSLEGKYGKIPEKVAKKLIKGGIIDYIGTDAHSKKSRAPYFNTAMIILNKWAGKERANQIFDRNAGLIYN